MEEAKEAARKPGQLCSIEEIAPFADKGCKGCWGKGVNYEVPVKKVPYKNDKGETLLGQLRIPRLCQCAVRRFVKAKALELHEVKEGAVLRWK